VSGQFGPKTLWSQAIRLDRSGPTVRAMKKNSANKLSALLHTHFLHKVVKCKLFVSVVLQAFVLQKRNPNMLTDGWKWKVRGSAKLPARRPLYRRSLYFYESQEGVESQFQKKVFERLDDG